VIIQKKFSSFLTLQISMSFHFEFLIFNFCFWRNFARKKRGGGGGKGREATEERTLIIKQKKLSFKIWTIRAVEDGTLVLSDQSAHWLHHPPPLTTHLCLPIISFPFVLFFWVLLGRGKGGWGWVSKESELINILLKYIIFYNVCIIYI
jgi:hypothetical protein